MTQNAEQILSQLLRAAYEAADRDWLMEHSRKLTALSAPQTFPAYETAARYLCDLLRENGFDAEYLEFPADGKTVYGDACMPMAWDATVGRLTVLGAGKAFSDPVIADFDRLPIHLVKHSTATPPEGVVTRVVTESRMLGGEDCTGAMVLLETGVRPTAEIISMLLDLGAMGFISDYSEDPVDDPDGVYWANAAIDGSGWHATLEDRDFIGFSISPRNGRKLRELASAEVTVKVECDGRRYGGTLPAVTALIPGKQQREVWLLARTCEPCGMESPIGVIGVAKTLGKMIAEGVLPAPEFSMRLVFAMEVHGFAAVAAHFGGSLRDRALGAINMDGFFGGECRQLQVFYAPLAVPFYGNFLLKLLSRVYSRVFSTPEVVEKHLSHHSDMFMSDATVGLPTVWPCGAGVTGLDGENFARALGYYTALAGGIVCMNRVWIPAFVDASAELARESLQALAAQQTALGDSREKMAYMADRIKAALENYKVAASHPAIDAAIAGLEIPEPGAPSAPPMAWLDYADHLIPARVGVGLPFDRMQIPKKKRRSLPGGGLFSQFFGMLSAMDGKKTLKRCICEAFWQNPRKVTEKEIKKYVDGAMYLADWGYLSVENAMPLNKEKIVAGLKKLGVQKGDVLLVHSGLSYLGHIIGGAETVLDALEEAVGPEGTVMVPTFNRPYVGFEGTVNKSRIYRPFCKEFFDNISTGAVPKAMLYRPGVIRSAHVTHSWAGFGKMAEHCLSAHGCLEAPASQNSPMAKALALGGKVLFFGSDIDTNTFIHYLEDKSGAPYLEHAIVKLKDENGVYHTEVIHNHLPGHRSFYGAEAREGKFYKEAFRKGLQVAHTELGMGRLQMMDLRQLDEIGMELFREDPLATLCDKPTCRFCRKYRQG